MKLLIICNKPETVESAIKTGKGKINSLNMIYAFILGKELRSKHKVTVDIKSIEMNMEQISKLDNYDAILCTGNKTLASMNTAFVNGYKSKCNNKLWAINETNAVIGQENTLFYFYDKRNENKNNVKCIKTSWGCCHPLLQDKTVAGQITILVDHTYYGDSKSVLKRDYTQKILDSLLEYKINSNNSNIVIKHIVDNQVTIINSKYTASKFTRKNAIDFRSIYDEYNKSDIFVTTHPESFGLTPIECTGSGTLVVCPKGHLKPAVMSKLHGYEIADVDNIDWKSIIETIDKRKSIEMSHNFSYDHLIKAMLTEMKAN